MSHYAIMRSDLRRRADVQVDRRVNRKAAEALVRRLNRQAGRRGPLYYVERVDKQRMAS